METFKKRQKKMRRLERRRDKDARRIQRKQESAAGDRPSDDAANAPSDGESAAAATTE